MYIPFATTIPSSPSLPPSLSGLCRFYGSRYDNEGNLASSGGSLDPVAEELADLASLIAQVPYHQKCALIRIP